MTHTLIAPHRTTSDLLPLFRPAVRRREHLNPRARLATVALSASLTAVVELAGRAQSEDALARRGLRIRQAWDESARQLIAAAQTVHGTRFWTRPVSDAGLEVRSDAAPVSAWLAHPRPFQLLNEHLKKLLDTPQPVYLLPDADTLLAFPDFPVGYDPVVPRARWLSPSPLIWQRGFPTEVPAAEKTGR